MSHGEAGENVFDEQVIDIKRRGGRGLSLIVIKYMIRISVYFTSQRRRMRGTLPNYGGVCMLLHCRGVLMACVAYCILRGGSIGLRLSSRSSEDV